VTEPNWALARKRQNLEQRARIMQMIRAFFVAQGYLEVETPLLIPGNAPEVHIDAVPAAGGFLQTSPELCMKRLLAAGYPKIFQISHCWRQGERGARHLPEFSMLEWYQAGADYRTLMSECEALLQYLCPAGALTWQGQRIALAGPWPRLGVTAAFERYASLSLDQALQQERYEELLTEEVEPQLGLRQPVFLLDYPAGMAALARLAPDNPEVAERFELYLAGLELANAFSELTDPDEQARRFAADEQTRRKLGQQPYPSADKFLAELRQLPAAAGIALGLDRLAMLLCNAGTIDAVVAFTPEDL
jgi:elongation factor P--(R)-beta-lysine ligase